MNIIEKKLTEIFEYENNPRNNDNAVDFVAESIKQFGFKVPIVIDKDSVIIAGHTRYKAAKKLGLKKVPCIMADDLNEEQVKAFRLADNKVAEKAQWDFRLLLQEIEEIDGFVMSDFGFSNIESINLDGYAENDEVDDEEETGEEPEPKLQQCPHCGEWVEV